MQDLINPLSANITKWSNTLKQFVGKLATNCLSVFDHFVGLALKGVIVQSGTTNFYVFHKHLRVTHGDFKYKAGDNGNRF